MAGSYHSLSDELFDYAHEVIRKHNTFPYVSFLLKNHVVVPRGFNQTHQKLDESLHCDVVAIRNAQQAMETGDLSGYTLFSLFEPTILSFDLAMFTGIRHFIWHVDKEDLPESYSVIPYGPHDYARLKPNEINIEYGKKRDIAKQIMQNALSQNLSLITEPFVR